MAYYLRTLAARPELFDGEKLIFKQLQPLLLLAYLERQGEQSRLSIAKTFWPNLDKEKRFARLSEVLRLLSKDAPDAILKLGEERLVAQVNSDIHELFSAIKQEDYRLLSELYDDHFLATLEHNQRLNLTESPELYDWLLSERETLLDTYREALIRHAELKAAQESFEDAADLAWKAFNLKTEQSLLLPKEFEGIHTLLLSNDAPQATHVAKEALKQFDKVEIDFAQDQQSARAKLKKPGNIPQSPNKLIGREAELEVCKALVKNSVRLLTLLGPPGIGKTHFGTELARSLQGYRAFRDGVYVVWLEPLNTPEAFLETLARILKIQIPSARDTLDYLAETLASKRLLLYLDNAEHLLSLTQTLDELLNRCPNLKIILSSRELVPSDWAHSYSLEGLGYPTSETILPEEVSLYPALVLFLEFAQKARREFGFRQDNLTNVINLCSYVKGLPLALKLAASWLDSSTTKTVAQELAQNLHLFDDLPNQQRGLSASFELSWQRLQPEMQEVYCKLSIFQGGFTLEAAQTVTGASLGSLRILKNKSLLEWFEASDRYTFHPLLQQFAKEKLDEKAEQEVAETKHSNYYLNKLQVITKGEQEERNLAMRWLPRELNNIEKAWEFAYKERDLVQLRDSAHPLERLYDESSQQTRGEQLLDKAAQRLDETNPDHHETLGNILASQAWLNCRLAKYDKAIVLAKRSLELSPDFFQAQSTSLNCLTVCYEFVGELQTAENYAIEAIEITEPLSGYRAVSLMNLGHIQQQTGEYNASKSTYEKAISIAEGLNKGGILASLYANYSEILIVLGEYEKALNILYLGLDIADSLNQSHWLANLNLKLAQLAFYQKDVDQAQILCLKFLKKPLSPSLELLYLEFMIELNLERQQHDLALQYLKASIPKTLNLGVRPRLMDGILLILEYYWVSEQLENYSILYHSKWFKEHIKLMSFNARMKLEVFAQNAPFNPDQRDNFPEHSLNDYRDVVNFLKRSLQI